MFSEDGKDELTILLLNLARIQLEHQVLEFGEEIILSFEFGSVKRNNLILQLVDP